MTDAEFVQLRDQLTEAMRQAQAARDRVREAEAVSAALRQDMERIWELIGERREALDAAIRACAGLPNPDNLIERGIVSIWTKPAVVEPPSTIRQTVLRTWRAWREKVST